jgi:competence protein ComFC
VECLNNKGIQFMLLTAGYTKSPAYLLYHSFWNAIDWLYPPVCGGCGKAGKRWCSQCQSATRVIDQNLVCIKCGHVKTTALDCPFHKEPPLPFKELRSWAEYGGPLREAILSLKYKHNLGMGEELSIPLIHLYQSLKWDIDLVIPVPLSLKKYQERGYNQSTLLARPLSLAFGIRFAPNALKKVFETHSQVELNSKERMENLNGAFKANHLMVKGKRILLMDDITTTGSTLKACAESLQAAGCGEVYALTLAKTVFTSGRSDQGEAAV